MVRLVDVVNAFTAGFTAVLAVVLVTPSVGGAADAQAAARPNIVWIVAEDASPHIGCYGETTIRTPHLDRLAADGVKFTRAFVTNPVCSPSRSAMVTGMYQTTLGAHNHRSQGRTEKRGGNTDYYDSYVLPVSSVPELFREAGYYVTNRGKEDYNFIAGGLYDGDDWTRRESGQPFFAQLQLRGGKARSAKVSHPVDPAYVTLPPYYADHPVIRQDWSHYLNSWFKADNDVGEIVAQLRDAGVLDRTVIFFCTDHGVSHLRGKQFLYEEGIHVPLIVWFGDGVRYGEGRDAGVVRSDLVEHIDIAATSLALAGIEIPAHLQGRDLFANDYRPREYVFSARDRCDETVECLRAVRTERFKYVRNFLSWMPHAQPNQYKDGKPIVLTMRKLHAERQLNDLQARMFTAPRPREELYDLQADPHETNNLADDPQYRATCDELRGVLYEWMVETRDVGLIPEPILEDLGRAYGSKYHVLRQPENAGLIRRLLTLMDAGEQGDRERLRRALRSERPSERCWAATWLGLLDDQSAASRLQELTDDEVPAVRVAASLALCRLGEGERSAPVLADHIDDENVIVGMYAIRALEQIGPAAKPVLLWIQKARESPYEFTRRYADRLSINLQN